MLAKRAELNGALLGAKQPADDDDGHALPRLGPTFQRCDHLFDEWCSRLLQHEALDKFPQAICESLAEPAVGRPCANDTSGLLCKTKGSEVVGESNGGVGSGKN